MTAVNVPVSEGTRVYLNFSVSLEDGSEVDSNFGQDPVDFVIGDGSLLPGFERLMFGMSAGERQMFKVAPENAFGQPNDNNMQYLPRDHFDEDVELEIGLVFSFADAAGGDDVGLHRALRQAQVDGDGLQGDDGRLPRRDCVLHTVGKRSRADEAERGEF